ncbi:2-amino-4-hydroxy-6-hydroxymethyldihydropteridine diphosphokinase [Anaerosalibacter massiliensis]|uniref:2-amino-4-hydroxy-6-hydroxymethyldihydropteridine diphosphokinase n=1 Tax=Anaerosalibacter massiliensis TaxID=1347392 RepID=A0A9X2S3N6_9FIRM|nr:2-amino-4-hydroxy-6-hydroxymethyldihydropteridine diphosphokinase [Anaerosalibacter massiliensis]MCR2042945.1 2-amino-4-hydroxy-6-hydroxymethyldihydropteridine diphosphokinase [Anaerosalibacter massiliensis]
MNTVYISFGSNIGYREKAIEDALYLINQNGMKITRMSNIFETEPYGYTKQPIFLNGVVEVETELSCRNVLERLLYIEKKIGRVRKFKWSPRIIDLDIIFFNDALYNEEDLKVPHPDMQNRDFVLKPLCDICPDFIHPVFKKTIKELLDDLK